MSDEFVTITLRMLKDLLHDANWKYDDTVATKSKQYIRVFHRYHGNDYEIEVRQWK